VPIVLYDDGEGYVPTAAAALAALGYTNIETLEADSRAGARRALRFSRT